MIDALCWADASKPMTLVCSLIVGFLYGTCMEHLENVVNRIHCKALLSLLTLNYVKIFFSFLMTVVCKSF